MVREGADDGGRDESLDEPFGSVAADILSGHSGRPRPLAGRQQRGRAMCFSGQPAKQVVREKQRQQGLSVAVQQSLAGPCGARRRLVGLLPRAGRSLRGRGLVQDGVRLVVAVRRPR